MQQFRVEAEVMVKHTIEYFIYAESKEDAEWLIQTGAHRGEGIEFDEQYQWNTEIIVDVEEIK